MDKDECMQQFDSKNLRKPKLYIYIILVYTLIIINVFMDII